MGLLLLFNTVARVAVVKANFTNTHVNIPWQVETCRQGHSSKTKECNALEALREFLLPPPWPRKHSSLLQLLGH